MIRRPEPTPRILRPRTIAACTSAVAVLLGTAPLAAPASATPVRATHPDPEPVGHRLPKVATMTGAGGAVASVDPVASQVGIDVLRRGGNAADAAIASAAALGVVEPYANGIGGGGFFVYYDARTRRVSTIDGRETAPAAMTATSFLEPDGKPMDFAKAVSSGLSVGIPGTPATWEAVLRRWGTRSLNAMLEPAQRIAERGFVVDEPFTTATQENAQRFALFPDTARIFLPGGQPVQPGTVLRQPDLAKTYQALRRHGTAALYRGPIGEAIVKTINAPRTAAGVTVPRGSMTTTDLRAYRALLKKPIHSTYHGYDVYGMPVPSSGGIAVAQSLNLLEQYEQRTGRRLKDVSNTQYLHRFAEASATAFADRNRYLGDVPGVPVAELISKGFAAERACGFSPDRAQARPIAPGVPDGSYSCAAAAAQKAGAAVHDGQATTHLTVVDTRGNVAAYTLTIEQFGGSGMVVPGYGFLLNNELTDFEFAPPTPGVPHHNLPGPGKRPRSSMSPTIVLRHGRPVMAAGAAGGATIITTTLQILTGHLDRGMPLVAAVGQPRISSRNGTTTPAEPELIASADGAALTAMGHTLASTATLGRATAIRVWPRGVATAATEPTRGGGGSAMVVRPYR